MSIANLITNIDDLKFNDGVSKVESRQIPCDRVVSGTGFSDGDLHFRFVVAGNTWWVPSKSFISMRTTISSTGTTQPTLASDMAPAMGYSACLWSGVDLRVADQPISRISSSLPQIDACRTRLMKSKAWLDGPGKSTNFWESSYVARQHSVVSNSLSEKTVKYVDLTGTSLAISTAGVPTGVGTLLSTELAVGDVIVVGGSRFTVLTASSNATGSDMTVYPAPAVAIAANTDFHREITTYEPARQQRNVIETVWRPPLGVFSINHPLPPGEYDLVLSPNTSKYNLAAIQVGSGAIGTKNVTMQNIYFNVATIEATTPPDDFTYYIDLYEIQLQNKSITTESNDEQSIDLTVPATTFALSYATQEVSAGSNPIYSPTLFKSGNRQEQNLKRLRINYAGQTIPNNETLDYSTAGVDYMTKLYTDTLMNSNAFDDDNGGPGESKQDWLDRGVLVHYKFTKVAGDGSTRALVQVTLNSNSTSNALLFAHYRMVAKITYRAKRVESVKVDMA